MKKLRPIVCFKGLRLLVVSILILFCQEAYVSGGGQVIVKKKHYQVVALTPHKAVFAEDQEWYSQSVNKWEQATRPRVEAFVRDLESQFLDEKLKNLGAEDPMHSHFQNKPIKEDGSFGSKEEREFYELKIELPGLAADIHSVEVETINIVFKKPPAKDRLVDIVKLVKNVLEKSLANFKLQK